MSAGFSGLLANGVTAVVEIKGYEDDQVKAKHTAAKRWVAAVNNWGQSGTWIFNVCYNPQLLGEGTPVRVAIGSARWRCEFLTRLRLSRDVSSAGTLREGSMAITIDPNEARLPEKAAAEGLTTTPKRSWLRNGAASV